MNSLIVSIRLTLVTLGICVAAYTALILGIAQAFTPGTANGSLVHGADGNVIGSRLIAQKFTQPRYFWPRPSAVDYNGAGAGGSNKSPTSPDLTERAKGIIAQFGAAADKPLPAELAAASGGGLDPHITEQGAIYQAERVAKARSLPQPQVEELIKQHAFAPGGILTPDRLVNVLELNLALDALK
jgi:K+-transporting ATPase ATPase C chain